MSWSTKWKRVPFITVGIFMALSVTTLCSIISLASFDKSPTSVDGGRSPALGFVSKDGMIDIERVYIIIGIFLVSGALEIAIVRRLMRRRLKR